MQSCTEFLGCRPLGRKLQLYHSFALCDTLVFTISGVLQHLYILSVAGHSKAQSTDIFPDVLCSMMSVCALCVSLCY